MFRAFRAEAIIDATEVPPINPVIRFVTGDNIRLTIRRVFRRAVVIKDNFQFPRFKMTAGNVAILPRIVFVLKIAAKFSGCGFGGSRV